MLHPSVFLLMNRSKSNVKYMICHVEQGCPCRQENEPLSVPDGDRHTLESSSVILVLGERVAKSLNISSSFSMCCKGKEGRGKFSHNWSQSPVRCWAANTACQPLLCSAEGGLHPPCCKTSSLLPAGSDGSGLPPRKCNLTPSWKPTNHGNGGRVSCPPRCVGSQLRPPHGG